MIKSILIKFGAVGFSSLVVYGTYNFIEKNEKIFNLLTGNNKLKNIRSDIDHENAHNNSNVYIFKNTDDISNNVQTQKLLETSLITNNIPVNTAPTSINTANSTSNGIDITTKKSEQETTSISNNITVNKPQNSTNATNSTLNGIKATTKKSETKITSISDNVTFNKSQIPNRRLRPRAKVRNFGTFISIN